MSADGRRALLTAMLQSPNKELFRRPPMQPAYPHPAARVPRLPRSDLGTRLLVERAERHDLRRCMLLLLMRMCMYTSTLE